MTDPQAISRRDFLGQSAAVTAAGLATWPWRSAAAAEQEAAARRWELGCFTRPFGRFPFAAALDGIAEAGFHSVGLMGIRLSSGTVALPDVDPEQAAEIGQMVQQRGLTTVSSYYGGPPVNQSFEAGVAAMRRMIDNCAAARCASILLGGTANEQLYDDYYRAVHELCDYALEKKVALVLKPHGGLNATGPQCRTAIEKVGHENFRLWYDPGNIFYYSEGRLDPVDDAATVDGLVTGMCVKDFLPPREVDVNPGSGKVDFPQVMARLHAGGFTGGPLVVETLAPGDLKTTIQNARNARRLLAELVGRL